MISEIHTALKPVRRRAIARTARAGFATLQPGRHRKSAVSAQKNSAVGHMARAADTGEAGTVHTPPRTAGLTISLQLPPRRMARGAFRGWQLMCCRRCNDGIAGGSDEESGMQLNGYQAAANNLPLNRNPHAPGTGDYFRWIREWHREGASVARGARQPVAARKFDELADIYFARAAAARLEEDE